jgi:hypothetical protein
LKPTPTSRILAPAGSRPVGQPGQEAGHGGARHPGRGRGDAVQERRLQAEVGRVPAQEVQVVAQAVAADARAGVEREIAPRLGRGGLGDLAGGEAERVGHARDLAHQADPGREEGVLEQLGELGHLGRGDRDRADPDPPQEGAGARVAGGVRPPTSRGVALSAASSSPTRSRSGACATSIPGRRSHSAANRRVVPGAAVLSTTTSWPSRPWRPSVPATARRASSRETRPPPSPTSRPSRTATTTTSAPASAAAGSAPTSQPGPGPSSAASSARARPSASAAMS